MSSCASAKAGCKESLNSLWCCISEVIGTAIENVVHNPAHKAHALLMYRRGDFALCYWSCASVFFFSSGIFTELWTIPPHGNCVKIFGTSRQLPPRKTCVKSHLELEGMANTRETEIRVRKSGLYSLIAHWHVTLGKDGMETDREGLGALSKLFRLLPPMCRLLHVN